MRTTNVSQLQFGDGADGIQAHFEIEPIHAKQPVRETTAAQGDEFSDRRLPTGAKRNPRGAASRAANRTAAGLEELLTLADAAAVLGISLRQFRRLVDGGKIAFVKVSERSPRIRPSELQRFLAASVVQYSEVKS
jgi:excisionase family DNA binding protein